MKAYQANLIAFESYLKSEQSLGGIETASYGEIRAWIVTLIESGNSSRTVNRKVSALRSYYKFQLSIKKIGDSP